MATDPGAQVSIGLPVGIPEEPSAHESAYGPKAFGSACRGEVGDEQHSPMERRYLWDREPREREESKAPCAECS